LGWLGADVMLRLANRRRIRIALVAVVLVLSAIVAVCKLQSIAASGEAGGMVAVASGAADAFRPIAVLCIDAIPLSDQVVADAREALRKFREWPAASPSEGVHLLRLHSLENGLGTESQQLINYLLDDGLCRDLRVPHQSILIDVGKGPSYTRYVPQTRPELPPAVAGEAHIGQIVSGLAESGVSLDTNVVVGNKVYTVIDVVEALARNINLEDEIEWIAVALALYRPTASPWISASGESLSFAAISEALMERLDSVHGGEAACGGTHVLYALAVVLRVNDTNPLWDRPELTHRIVAVLQRASRRLERTQSVDGSWDDDWHFPVHPVQKREAAFNRRVLITGHHLEWLALMPHALRPEEACITRAFSFHASGVNVLASSAAQGTLCACSHGLRAYLMCSGAHW
jgi:hypothetical protein